jgi:hypothetical protein
LTAGKRLDEWSAATVGEELSWLAFVDATRLLTADKQGVLALWQGPKVSQAYRIDNVTPGGWALSPGRKLLAVVQDKNCCLYDSISGTLRGVLRGVALPNALPGLPTTNRNGKALIAFSPDGRSLAVAHKADHLATRFFLSLWDLANGQLLGSYFIDDRTAWLEWYGSTRLLAGQNQVVSVLDLDAKVESVRFTIGSRPRHLHGSSNGLHWALADVGRGSLLGTYAFPEAELRRLADLVRRPGDQVLLAPGKNVSLKVVFKDPSDNTAKLHQDTISQVTQVLQQRGIGVAPDQPITLFIDAKESDTGKSLPVKTLSGAQAGQITNVPVKKLTCSLSLVSRDGKVWWQHEDSTPTSLFGMIRTQPGEGVAKRLYQMQWNSIPYRMHSIAIPSAIVRLGQITVALPVAITLTQ